MRTEIKNEIDRRKWSISKLAEEAGVRYPSIYQLTN